MTIEQRATALRERLEADAREQLWGTVAYPAVEAVIAEAIRAAVLAEREACAKVVPQFGEDPDQEECALWLNTILENAADAIRRRP